MRTQTSLAATVTLAAMVVQPLSAGALGPDRNLSATMYRVALVQAMDQCLVTMTNIGGVGGCAPSNSNTDGTPFTKGSVVIRARNRRSQVTTILKSAMATPPHALANKLVHTVIMMRVTRTSSSPTVTWTDQTLDCPQMAVPNSGNLLQNVTLEDCGLPSTLADDFTIKEVLSVQVVDDNSGKPIAVPGVRRKP